MKKALKGIAILAAIATVGAGASFAVGCGGNNSDVGGVKEPEAKEVVGVAYGIVHGGKYVGRASITAKGDKVTDATLGEICLPDHVTADKKTSEVSKDDAKSKLTATGDDYIIIESESTTAATATTPAKTTYTATAYYKTVKFSNVTMAFDATAKTYKIGDKTASAYLLADSVAAAAYYNSVLSGSVFVKVGEENKNDVMTENALSKDKNDYWTRKDKNNEDYSRWKMNRDATVNYVKEHGVANLLTLKQAATATPDAKEDKNVTYWMDGDISTGATWSDLNKANVTTYVTYAQLLKNAYDTAGTEYVGEYKYENPYAKGSYYGMKVKVIVKDGKIVNVEDITASDNVSKDWTVVSAGWNNKANWNNNYAALYAKYMGAKVSDVLAIKAGVAESGQPEGVDKNAAANEQGLVITGSTQGSIRLLLAVQDALKQVK